MNVRQTLRIDPCIRHSAYSPENWLREFGMRRVALIMGMVCLAGCDAPEWADDNLPTFEPAPAAAPAVPAEPAGTPTVDAPTPAAPEWSAELMGKTIADVAPGQLECLGNMDNVSHSYTGDPAGVQIVGWGWNNEIKMPVAQIVLVGIEATIVAAGETGLDRPDVPIAQPAIDSPTTGWKVDAPVTEGAYDAFGLSPDLSAACRLGHIEF